MPNNTLSERNASALAELQTKFRDLSRDVNLSRFDWRALMESGALVSLKVSRFRAQKTLTALDLGLDVAEMDQVSSLIDLGHRMILPKDVVNKFNTLETQARQKVRSSGLLTPAGLFVPARNYDALAAQIAEYKARFNDLVTELIDRLPEHRDTMQRDYVTLADQTYNRLQVAGTIYTPRYDFTDQFVDRCMATFPSSEDLRSKFAFDLVLSFVPTPYESQTDMPQFATAGDDLLALRRDVIEQQRQARETVVNGFLVSIQEELYSAVNGALGDVLSAMQTNGSLQGRSVSQLRNLVDKLGQLNFWQDKRLETIQEEITALLDRSAGTKRDADLDRALLETLQNESRSVLLSLGSEDIAGLAVVDTAPAVALPAVQTDSVRLSPLPAQRSGVALSAGDAGRLF